MGIILGMTGAVGVITISSKANMAQGDAWGDLFVLVNAVSYGSYLVLVKPLMAEYKALTVVKWVFTFGFLGILPFGIQEVLTTQ